ncbi:NRAMP (natural resistance-associated macrophage protein) metal ion transporters [Zhouia amylolytica]|uniref:NRAMP (Natural resistance-associated macrophage protein) metal ion transporters n=1 Tax=Zhouia amylolytica TaxID=376730 RepID=A0A1I6QVU7_9FLAO|nr:Nramp family divalent metal transporter [Zhouia amylolytica]MCQ0112143.1 Nramp family divalent metal transporter [Zhouia amylolytica]SFS56545.1 NRAMP (natural resistance-associated macrophage protein) metal ion transporters [Zhouia amylolytica]
MMLKWFKNIGPGTLVAAAFIGPGTVTVCTLAGVGFGFTLLWAMMLSIVAAIILQEMSSRIGIVTRMGLAEVIKHQIKSPLLTKLAVILILSAIVVGNTAYEAGNISGASLGLEALFGTEYWSFYPLVIGISAIILLLLGNYKVLERILIVLVLIMSISFIGAAVLTKPDMFAVFKGIFSISFPGESILTIVALVGTTVVPYNLFLHASLVKEKWQSEKDLRASRIDTIVSIIMGGLVSMSIIIAAAAIKTDTISSVLDLAKGLEPLYGSMAKYFLGIGLFAAGITSSVTAPLAAAYVADSCFNWKSKLTDWKFRMVWGGIIMVGIVLSSLKIKPIELIQFAQVANGILLPVVACFLVWVVNKKAVLKKYVNNKTQNIIAIAIVLIALLLGIKSILKVLALL